MLSCLYALLIKSNTFLNVPLTIVAAAVACNLALGHSMREAIDKACRYVNAGIRLSIPRGRGSGPINHFHSSYMLPFSPSDVCQRQSRSSRKLMEHRSHFVDYLISSTGTTWHNYTHHNFVQGLADGSLPVDAFQYYLVQDYLFLVC